MSDEKEERNLFGFFPPITFFQVSFIYLLLIEGRKEKQRGREM